MAAYTGFRFLTVVPASGRNDLLFAHQWARHRPFLYDLAAGEERRLFHKNDFYTDGLDFSPERAELVCAVAEEDGAVNVNLYNDEGRYKNVLTGGDSRDTHPRSAERKPTGSSIRAQASPGTTPAGLWPSDPSP